MQLKQDTKSEKFEMDKEIKDLKETAEQGNNLSLYWLARYYSRENIFQQNPTEAVNWFKKAAEGDLSFNWNGSGTQENRVQQETTEAFNEEFKSFKKNLNQGLYPNNLPDIKKLISRKLAMCYYFGEGVEKDYKEAIQWFKYAISDIEIGICYYRENDVEKAIEHLTEYKTFDEKLQAIKYLWLAYLTYIKNKSAIDKEMSPIDILASRVLPFLIINPDDPHREVINTQRIKDKIDEYIKKAEEKLVFLKKESFYCDDIELDFYFPNEIIYFLKNRSGVALALYHECKNEEKTSSDFLIKAASKRNYIACYKLGEYYKEKGLEYFDNATEYFKVVEQEFNKNKGYNNGKEINQWLSLLASKELKNIESIKFQKELEEKNEALQKSKEIIEKMMGRFEHSFRTPLNTIISSVNHKTLKSCRQNAQIMLGMLELIKIISTDDEQLKKDLISDKKGTANITSVLIRVIDNILLHLLSVSGVLIIQQHYIAYAKEHGKIDCSVDSDTWEDEHFDLEQALQIEWEQEFFLLTEQQTSLKQRLDWIEKHFFTLNLIGFDNLKFQFRESSIKDSFLTVLLTEILLNTFKYYSSENKYPVFLEWTEQDNHQVLSCRNPTSRDVYMHSKGSHNGHEFMLVLANKTGSKFLSSNLQDAFTVEFSIPNNILGVENEPFFMD